MSWACSTCGRDKICLQNLLKKPGGERWEDDIKTEFTEIGCEGVDWNNLVQNRYQWRAIVNTVIKLRAP
jgi:hypothetical protein